MEPEVRKSGCIVRSALLGCSRVRLSVSTTLSSGGCTLGLKGQRVSACFWKQCSSTGSGCMSLQLQFNHV